MLAFVIAAILLLPLILDLIIESVCAGVFNGYSELGPWAFRRRADGTFSRWQIAGQILLIALASILCLWALGYALMQFAELFIREMRR